MRAINTGDSGATTGIVCAWKRIYSSSRRAYTNAEEENVVPALLLTDSSHVSVPFIRGRLTRYHHSVMTAAAMRTKIGRAV